MKKKLYILLVITAICGSIAQAKNNHFMNIQRPQGDLPKVQEAEESGSLKKYSTTTKIVAGAVGITTVGAIVYFVYKHFFNKNNNN